MKFVLNTVNKVSGRLGYFVQSETGKQYHTPLLVQTTKSGSIPYLSKEVFHYITKDEQILQISLSTTDHMEDALKIYDKGITSYVGYSVYPSLLVVKDPCEISPSGFHEKDIIPLFTRKGKIQLTAEKYMNFVKIFKPDMYHTLCDSDTNFDSSKKRILKSVIRTENFFQKCIEIHKTSDDLKKSFLFAPIVGGYCKEARMKSIKTISHSDVDGYILDGFHKYGNEAIQINKDATKEVVSYCLQAIGYHEKPRMMLGAYHPLVAIELINLGIDVFDTSYVYLTAYNFKALTFSYDLNNKTEDKSIIVNLNDEKYKEDFTPLLENCECLACKKHTKAYIYHLIQTKELLGPILLMIHNTYHYLEYFNKIRLAIAKDELQKLIEHIQAQTKDVEKDFILNSDQSFNFHNHENDEKEIEEKVTK